MFALLTPSVVGVALALMRRRSLAGLTRQRIAWWPLGFAAFALELALTSTPLGQHPLGLAWGPGLWMMALAAMAAVLARNAWQTETARRYAWGTAALGVLLNLI
ncbi:MAG TPA: hypothetical protein VF937_04445, partial [Chloroflexota bacterium]